MALVSTVVDSLRRLGSRRDSRSVSSGETATREASSAVAIVTQAMAQLREERPAEALALFEQALAVEPHNADLLNHLASVLQGLGKIDEALARYTQAVELRPDSAPLWVNLGCAQLAGRQWGAAVAAFRRALVVDDRYAPAWSALGVALAELGQDRDAEDACREALALQPGWRDGIVNLATVLATQGRAMEAQAELDGHLAQDQGWTAGWQKLAAIQAAEGDLAAAEVSYRRAWALEPASSGIAFSLAHTLLGQDKYEEGFSLFEKRFEAIPAWFTDEVRSLGRDESARRWRGEPVTGRHVAIIGEQGFGDQLMMFRYVPRLRALGAAKVSVVCAPELVRAAERIAGVGEVMSVKEAARPGDAGLWVPALSLPHCVRSTAHDLPDATYLDLPGEARTAWPVIAALPGLRVGLVWAGNSTADDRARRDFNLEMLAPLLTVAGVSWVSLQKGPASAQFASGAWAGRIVDPMPDCRDFLDTATVIANLDLVISVDTAVVHLAGAIGVPVWLMLKVGGEWRWGATSSTSAWYPKMRIFRQARVDNWSDVASGMHLTLAREVDAAMRARYI
ncbi:MAG: tetratricopeptide repeat protein [Burkholderiales bacterium]|nr:tetratricopeptide repeat protein [Burkholderiales bacterium]